MQYHVKEIKSMKSKAILKFDMQIFVLKLQVAPHYIKMINNHLIYTISWYVVTKWLYWLTCKQQMFSIFMLKKISCNRNNIWCFDIDIIHMILFFFELQGIIKLQLNIIRWSVNEFIFMHYKVEENIIAADMSQA